jgi:hypothetical protein
MDFLLVKKLDKKISARLWSEYKTNPNLENVMPGVGDRRPDHELSQKNAWPIAAT